MNGYTPFYFFIIMSDNMNLQGAMNIAMSAMRNSDDFTDSKSVASFMIFMSRITQHPSEVVSCNNLEDLGIIASSIMTSDFVVKFPTYYGVSQGEVLGAVGFYAYMKQLEMGIFLDAHYPAFILLLHHGRRFLNNIYKHMLMKNSNLANSFSVYNPFDRIEYEAISSKVRYQMKAFEYIILTVARNKGYYDNSFNSWFNELSVEFGPEFKQEYKKYFEEAKRLYKFVAKDLISDSPFDYAKND